MRPHTGGSVVAVLYHNSLATYAPAPSVVLTGRSVDLVWQVEENTTDQYLVYRRAENGLAGALFDEPRSAVGDIFSYRDEPFGYPDGTVMFYSYSIIQGDLEVARSPETRIELRGMPMASNRLLGNVPNPFNPMTEVRFELAKATMVRVSVYDISGRLIKTLVHEHLEAGPHNRLWEGKDFAGRQVPSGSYYLRLETNERTDHRKMMLLK